MKRFLCSSVTKLIAFILCSVFAAASAYLFCIGFINSNGVVYLFEDSYEDSFMARQSLKMAVSKIDSVVWQAERMREGLVASVDAQENPHGYETVTEAPVVTPYPITAEEVQSRVDEYIKNDIYFLKQREWEYYIKYNGKEYANTSDRSYEAFDGDRIASGVVSDSTRYMYFSNPDHVYFNTVPMDRFVMCVRMSDNAFAENSELWQEMKDKGDKAAPKIVAMLIALVTLAAYLFIVAGRKAEDDEIHLMLFDRVFAEITFVLFAAGVIAEVMFNIVIFEELIMWQEIGVGYIGIFAVTLAMSAIVLALALSLVRSLKAKDFLRRSLIYRFCKWALGIIKRILGWLWRIVKWFLKKLRNAKSSIMRFATGRKSNIVIAAAFLLYSGVIFIICTFSGLERIEAGLVLAVFLILIASVFVMRRLNGFERLRDGISKIRNGNTSHKIEGCPDGVLSAMADDINSIGDGMREAVSEQVKAERMKSELITNVSHDLKTPLTSIINYADLLCAEKLTPDEANDYAKIIRQKGERLKNLTSDLFDISKVQSGNEEFNIEDIDICLLINQSMAEMNEQIQKSGLQFKLSCADKEVFVKADGRKMSRVFENLIVNCVKYAMKNTRVYIDIVDMEHDAVVEIKNIAGYEMDFDEKEIAERFVRGDSARTSEGSGLGLAIVKSYVEGCGGSVDIKKDGDLFKVIIHFLK
ncbi:MAG: HAMP domain-containing histidine kinase [Oscillospiraceae bacterium]|nr:HAMP domain-containing histidine kinase [Oscillospiraceae bacterium]